MPLKPPTATQTLMYVGNTLKPPDPTWQSCKLASTLAGVSSQPWRCEPLTKFPYQLGFFAPKTLLMIHAESGAR